MIVLEKMYNKVDMATLDNTDGEEPQDVNGYLGQTKFYRPKQGSVSRLIPEDEFIEVFVKNNRLDSIQLTIKEIDRDHNGYVT